MISNLRIFGYSTWFWWGGIMLLNYGKVHSSTQVYWGGFLAVCLGILAMSYTGFQAFNRWRRVNREQGEFQINLKNNIWRYISPLFSVVWLYYWIFRGRTFISLKDEVFLVAILVTGAFIYVLAGFLLGNRQVLYFGENGLEVRAREVNKEFKWQDLSLFTLEKEQIILRGAKDKESKIPLTDLRPRDKAILALALKYYEDRLPEVPNTEFLTGEF
ncbi:MAG: hypothetical protein H6581_26845 [Bacteroidia bacterium]|nr:hypothetical protein [Bacteroidia bacterium]